MGIRTSLGFFNRELSWLEFNRRVLEEACDRINPVLERLKFLVITASNLDEFFMVRVGGLHMARKTGLRKKDSSGLTPLAQLKEIDRRTRGMMSTLHQCFNKAVTPELEQRGIRHIDMNELTAEQESLLHILFNEELFPVITPIAVEFGEPLPRLETLTLQLLVGLWKKSKTKRKECYAVISLTRAGSRIIPFPASGGYAYVLREEIVKRFAEKWFPGYEVRETVLFRITRNADFVLQEDEAPDLLTGVEGVLEERKTGECIRLEVEASVSNELLEFLCSHISVEQERVYLIEGVLNIGDFIPMVSLEGYEELKAEAWPPQPPAAVMSNEPIFNQIAHRDMLFYHPYESFDPVIRFVEEAAADADTMAIKMVLYRTSSESVFVQALKRAAENGVNVTVLMELKARFDEARNMNWARDLEQCGGIQVIYGVKGYKTHAKVCMVVRREPAGVVRYCHFGTGNYNETTARFYGDVSYLTCNAELGADASGFFNALCGYAQPRDFHQISMAPVSMREKLVTLIDFEIERAKKGKKAAIHAKMNALTDVALAEKLYEAARTGVRIELNVRGICCLKPAENIKVISIIDRYLEHARILHFHHGGKPRVFISSADWMSRNLDKRLELMIPVEDANCQEQLISILHIHMTDNQRSWVLQRSGAYRRTGKKCGKKVRSQQVLFERACQAIAHAEKNRGTQFEPHRPSAKET